MQWCVDSLIASALAGSDVDVGSRFQKLRDHAHVGVVYTIWFVVQHIAVQWSPFKTVSCIHIRSVLQQ
jgi:hypothetical protein